MLRVAWLLLLAACASDDSCPMTIAAYCSSANNGACPSTWDVAQQPSTWGCDGTRFLNISVLTCGGVHVVRVFGIDSGEDYYYGASGALFRVEGVNANFSGKQNCIAGAGHLDACDDPNPVALCPGP